MPRTNRPPTLGEYSLFIRNTGDSTCLRFEYLDDLKTAIRERLSPSEINSGVVEKLTDFRSSRIKNSMVENKWRNFSVCAYVLD